MYAPAIPVDFKNHPVHTTIHGGGSTFHGWVDRGPGTEILDYVAGSSRHVVLRKAKEAVKKWADNQWYPQDTTFRLVLGRRIRRYSWYQGPRWQGSRDPMEGDHISSVIREEQVRLPCRGGGMADK